MSRTTRASVAGRTHLDLQQATRQGRQAQQLLTLDYCTIGDAPCTTLTG